jgi:hypothetical protein
VLHELNLDVVEFAVELLVVEIEAQCISDARVVDRGMDGLGQIVRVVVGVDPRFDASRRTIQRRPALAPPVGVKNQQR